MRQLFKSLQSQILYARFSCKTPQREGKLHTLHFMGKRRPRKTGTNALIIYPREKFYEIRTKETLSLNVLRVTDPVILGDIR